MIDELVEDDNDLQNDKWLKGNFLDLMQKYPREWIAVLNGIIIARAGTKAGVQNMADEVADGEEYSIYFIPPTGTFTDVLYERR